MEKKEEKKMTFGRYLSAGRYEKGLDLESIARNIKVNYSLLVHIENEDHSKLPDTVFVKGFVQAYADILDLDKTEAVKLYLESQSHYHNTLKAQADLAGYTTKVWTRFFLALTVLVIVIGLSVFLMPLNGSYKPDLPDAEKVTDEVAENEVKTEITQALVDSGDIDTTEPAETEKEIQKPALPKNMYLSIQAIEETWVKIIIDRQKAREFTLKAGDLKELKGEKKFNLLIGNAAGVKVRLNDKPVNIIGKSGQVVTVMLP